MQGLGQFHPNRFEQGVTKSYEDYKIFFVSRGLVILEYVVVAAIVM